MASSDDNRARVREAFTGWEAGNTRPFFDLVDDDVTWTVIGTTDISGTYEGKSVFLAGAGRLMDRFAGPLTARIVDVRADGDKVFLQWEGSATTVEGAPYEQTYCWVLTMGDDTIVDVVAYLDTELVSAVLG